MELASLVPRGRDNPEAPWAPKSERVCPEGSLWLRPWLVLEGMESMKDVFL